MPEWIAESILVRPNEVGDHAAEGRRIFAICVDRDAEPVLTEEVGPIRHGEPGGLLAAIFGQRQVRYIARERDKGWIVDPARYGEDLAIQLQFERKVVLRHHRVRQTARRTGQFATKAEMDDVDKGRLSQPVARVLLR